jgi:tRNA1Val (adenine37-N6)-methyltransferase
MAFHFQQFLIEDEKSTMRTGTDAMLLGAWAIPPSSGIILDIGTGCGVLALMMAQHSESRVVAIDPDLPSIMEARNNFERSRWSDRLTAVHTTLQDFSTNAAHLCDFIITNPPYFSNSLKSPFARKNSARHDDGLSLEELVAGVTSLLSEEGRFALILPSEPAKKCHLLCLESGLHLSQRMSVYPKAEAPSGRTLMEFSRRKFTQPSHTELTMLNAAGKFSTAYLNLTSRFHRF